MKRYIILAAMLCGSSLFTALNAQNLTIFRIAGKVEANGKTLSINTKIPIKTVVKISEEGMLELLDEKTAQRYTIKGKSDGIVTGTIEKLSTEKGNSVLKMTERYVAYVKGQMGNSGNIAKAKKFTDFATVTRSVEKADEKKSDGLGDDWMREFEDLSLDFDKEYEEFRSKADAEYDGFVRQAWQQFSATTGMRAPQDEKIVAVRYVPDGNEGTDRISFADVKKYVKKVFQKAKKTVTANPTDPVSTAMPDMAAADEDVIEVSPQVIHEEQPQPIQPIHEVKIEEQKPEMQARPAYATMPFTFYGTDMQVRLDETKRMNVGKITPNNVADALKLLSGPEYDNALYDCLQLRQQYNLGDWAYLEMLTTISDQFCGRGTRESVLLTGFLYYKSGYRIKFATDNTNLYLLVASKHQIYNRPYFEVDNYLYYPLDPEAPEDLYFCRAKFPEEKSLSLFLPTQQDFTVQKTQLRTIKSEKYPDFSIQVSVNKNMIDFYNTYPSSEINNNKLTRWVMYADTPLDRLIKEQIYPQLKAKLEGLSEVEKVSRLLDLVQTGFVYKLDDEVWGGDRPFFAEETLFYPYCDCEDRSILLSRLVRDLVGLKVLLIYYPGHLATAIHFNTPIKGACYQYDNEIYTVCDPTYIGASVGKEMTIVDSKAAKVVLLP